MNKYVKLVFNIIQNFIEYVLIIAIWKKIFKRSYRFIFNTHEIQRNVMLYNNYDELKNCILSSHQLSSLHSSFKYNDLNIDRIISSVILIKNIDCDANEYNRLFILNLKKILRNQNNLLRIRNELKELYSEKFNSQNEEHTSLLYGIWEKLKNNRDIRLIDKRWLDIGFQGQDPSTDLRGAGILGLRNLHHFVKYSLFSNEVYLTATNQNTWYFFSASGINFTGKIIELLEGGKLEKYLVSYNDDILRLTNLIYELLYSEFNKLWIRKGITDFMKFNILLEEFIDKNAIYLILKSGIFNNSFY